MFLRVGDTMRVAVEGLGEQEQRVVAFNQAMGVAWSSGENTTT
jgi:hypothetical protein